MKAHFKVAIALVAGAAIGGAAIQGLHAQATPKAYVVTEIEVIDQAAQDAYISSFQFRTTEGPVFDRPVCSACRVWSVTDMVLDTLLGMSETDRKPFTDNNTTARNGS